MSKHTPGPWRWQNVAGFTYLIGSNDIKIISAVAIDGDESDDDLIIAAPELLEALMEVHALTECEMPARVWRSVISAIAKATGNDTP